MNLHMVSALVILDIKHFDPQAYKKMNYYYTYELVSTRMTANTAYSRMSNPPDIAQKIDPGLVVKIGLKARMT